MPSPSDRTSSPQIQWLVHVYVKPEMQQQALSAMTRLVEATQREDTGCIRFEGAIDTPDATHSLGYEVWASQADLDLHSKKAHGRNFFAEIGDYVVDPTQPLSATRSTPILPLPTVTYSQKTFRHVKGWT